MAKLTPKTKGRPTKLDDDLKNKAQKYLNGGHLTVGDVVPTIAGLARYLKVARQTLTNFGNQDSDFLGTLEDIKTEQERLLINNGLVGGFNSAIVKLMLSNHGYSDKIDNISSDGTMTPKTPIFNFNPVKVKND